MIKQVPIKEPVKQPQTCHQVKGKEPCEMLERKIRKQRKIIIEFDRIKYKYHKRKGKTKARNTSVASEHATTTKQTDILKDIQNGKLVSGFIFCIKLVRV